MHTNSMRSNMLAGSRLTPPQADEFVNGMATLSWVGRWRR